MPFLGKGKHQSVCCARLIPLTAGQAPVFDKEIEKRKNQKDRRSADLRPVLADTPNLKEREKSSKRQMEPDKAQELLRPNGAAGWGLSGYIEP